MWNFTLRFHSLGRAFPLACRPMQQLPFGARQTRRFHSGDRIQFGRPVLQRLHPPANKNRCPAPLRQSHGRRWAETRPTQPATSLFPQSRREESSARSHRLRGNGTAASSPALAPAADNQCRRGESWPTQPGFHGRKSSGVRGGDKEFTGSFENRAAREGENTQVTRKLAAPIPRPVT